MPGHRLIRPRAFWRDRRGIAAVEFALVLPVGLLLSLLSARLLSRKPRGGGPRP